MIRSRPLDIGGCFMGVAIAAQARPGWMFRAVAQQALQADGLRSDNLGELERQVRRAVQLFRADGRTRKGREQARAA
jgi:hypothetical protein